MAAENSNEFFSVEGLIDSGVGLFAGCVSLAIGHPFDTVKLRQQCSASGENSRMLQCAKNTFKNEGARGFFKGLAFPLFAAGVQNSIFFGVYGRTLAIISPPEPSGKSLSLGGDSPGGSAEGKAPINQPSYMNIFLAGCVGGAVQAVPFCVVENVKVKLQAQTGPAAKSLYKGPVDCLLSVYRNHGVKGCFRGLTPTIAREIPGFSSYMLSYEWLRNQLKSPDEEQPKVLWNMLAGGLAGMFSWVTNIPIDVVKSRMQTDDLANPRYRNSLDCFVKSYNAEGYRIFWRGLPVICLRAFPHNAVHLTVYSYTLAFIQSLYRDRKESKVKVTAAELKKELEN